MAPDKIIAEFEGCKLTAYQDVAGIWTIGYGAIYMPDGTPIKKGDKITQEQADSWLKQDTARFQEKVKALVKVMINGNQLSALTSLAYNIGIGAFSRSTLLKLLNLGRPKEEVAAQFLRWNMAGGKVVKGLTMRRKKEAALFLS